MKCSSLPTQVGNYVAVKMQANVEKPWIVRPITRGGIMSFHETKADAVAAAKRYEQQDRGAKA